MLADDNGAWTVNGRKLWYVEFDGTVCNITRDKEPGSDFQLIRHFYRNDSSKDFHRVIVVLQSLRDKTIHTLCLVQYYFDNEEHSIEVKPHGNSKTPKSYMRTQDSVKDRIRGLIPFQSPKEVVHTVLESIGGTEKIKSCGEKVRDRTQVKNFKRKSEDSTDDIFLVTEMYNEEKQEPSKAFIRKLTVTPEFTVALATDQQLLDIERFCTDPRQFSILGVDTTFNVGTYYITMTTYRHLQLLTKQKTHPVMIGPVLLHQQRKRSSYIQLPSSMLELRPALRNILAIGTDGEKNLYDAFVSLNPNMTHLLCDIHMRDNIKSKLCALDFSQDARTKILNDIFGRNVGEAKVKGLIDTETDTEFETMLNDVIEEWEQIQPSDKIGQFVKYFKDNKVQQIQSSMTADVRSRCGLGYPPAPFTQNANECMNKVLKQRGVGEPARLTVKDFICKLKTLVNRQDEEAFLAMLGQGEKTLAPEYQYLQVQESRYYRMTSVQKQATRKKFFCSGVDTSSAVGQRESSNASHADEASLTVKPEESGITSVPFEMFRSMFTKAAMMKTSGEDIMKAPGRDHNNYMVTSSSTNVPHLVAVDDSKGSFICDKNCAQFSSVKICAHVLSVADHVGQLPSFLTHFKKTSMKKNLTTLANFGLPSDRGKKASKSTQKRKGPVRPVVATYMDRPKQPAKKPKHPDPLPNSYELTLLNFCNAQVQKCYGCAGTLKLDGGTIPEPPQNMAVVTKLQREYYKDGRKQQSATFTNAYFHLSVSCIKRHNQYFVVELVHVSDELKPHLTVEHMSILKAMGIMC